MAMTQEQIDEAKRQRNEIAGSDAVGMTQDMRDRLLAEIDRRIAEAEGEARRGFYDELGRQYGDVPEDENTRRRSEELYQPRGQEIDRGMYDAGKASAAGYSRRGIGGSGYASAAQGQIAQAAASERARARASAFNEAIAEGQKSILGEAQISHMGDPFLAQLIADAERRYDAAVARRQAEQDFFRDFVLEAGGRVAGYAAGGPAGAAAGGNLTGGGMGGGGVQAPAEILTGPNGQPYWSDGTPFYGY